jgi:hypothetical protein
VVAFSRAFEKCDPIAVSCTLSGTWPTATLSWAQKDVTPNCDGFFLIPPVNDSCIHFIFTIQDAAHRNHIFEVNSWYRVITYQPPEATSPVFYYALCAYLANGTQTNCFGYTTWPGNPCCFDPRPLLWDLVSTVTRNGQVWSYTPDYQTGTPPYGHSQWVHTVTSPLGPSMSARGNATPGSELSEGPIDTVIKYDGTLYGYEASTRNVLRSMTTPQGLTRLYGYDGGAYTRQNLTQITQNAIPNSGLNPIIQSATYPEPGVVQCANPVTCNKPLTATDANGNEVDFAYDPVHGGMTKETDPAVNGINPQTRRTYVQRNAWYLNSSGTMTRDAHAVWLLATESFCRTVAASPSGTGCTVPSDEVVTTYDYGPDSGPNNLILRGKTVTGDGHTLRTCYAHDQQGNKIWESSPNANPASCPNY